MAPHLQAFDSSQVFFFFPRCVKARWMSRVSLRGTWRSFPSWQARISKTCFWSVAHASGGTVTAKKKEIWCGFSADDVTTQMDPECKRLLPLCWNASLSTQSRLCSSPLPCKLEKARRAMRQNLFNRLLISLYLRKKTNKQKKTF